MNQPFEDRKRARHEHRASRSQAVDLPGAWAFKLSEHLQFFQAFLREPTAVGALSPSSPALARSMVSGFDLKRAQTVVELGPGTGAFTGLIRRSIGKRTTFLAMELDSKCAQGLRQRYPDVTVYNESAERLKECLAMHGRSEANYIISGLPWASLRHADQDRILDAILASLASEGVFTTFAYVHARFLPKARQFRNRLERHFGKVTTSPVVWKNLPPAVVYRCSALRS